MYENKLQEYLHQKECVQLADKKTLINYNIDLTQVLPFVFDKEMKDITLEDIQNLKPINVVGKLKQLQSENKYATSTINRRLASLKSFYSYYSSVYGFPNVLKTMKNFNDDRIKEHEVVSQDTMRELIEKAKQTNNRDYYILSMLFSCGLRAEELLTLTKGRIYDNEIVVIGKRNKLRRIPLNDRAKDAIKQYVDPNLTNEDKVLNLSYQGLRYVFTKYTKSIGLSLSKVHSTRHSFSTSLLSNNTDIQTISELLGHANTQITSSTYLHSQTKTVAVNTLNI